MSGERGAGSVLITGATDGLGRAAALLLANAAIASLPPGGLRKSARSWMLWRARST
jgi:hypothetical protein